MPLTAKDLHRSCCDVASPRQMRDRAVAIKFFDLCWCCCSQPAVVVSLLSLEAAVVHLVVVQAAVELHQTRFFHEFSRISC